MAIGIKLLIVCLFLFGVNGFSDYYWREWNGTIPNDAFVATSDSRGTSYLAQAYVPGSGLLIGQIQGNQLNIPVNPIATSISRSSLLKVLCTRNNSLRWFATNSTTSPDLVKYVKPVLGGTTYQNKTIYIGKYDVGIYSYVGSVSIANYLFYYASLAGTSSTSQVYDVLIHELE